MPIPPYDHRRPSVILTLALFLIPLAIHLSLIGHWSLDRDEYYTYVDSQRPLVDLLRHQSKPLFYLICHGLLNLGLDIPLAFLLRAPSALAASLVAPAFYWFLWSPRDHEGALFASILVVSMPWLCEVAQTTRFYSLMFLLASVAALALYQWVKDRRSYWWIVFLASAMLAAATHTTAVMLFPSGIVAAAAVVFHDDPRKGVRLLRRYGLPMFIVGVVLGAGMIYLVRKEFALWLASEHGQFGNYDALQIGLALLVYLGIPTWALAIAPLIKSPGSWAAEDVFLAVMSVCGTVPFLFLVPLGGGVAPRYLMSGVVCVIVLAARHWREIDDNLSSLGLRGGLAASLLAFQIPCLASLSSDGNHFDYRAAARFIESLDREDPIVLSSGHLMLDHYLECPRDVHELTTFENGVPRSLLNEFVARSRGERRPLLVVSREDRTLLSVEDQAWLYQRFALLRSIESPRFDHRRFRVAIYEFRPTADVRCHDENECVPVAGRTHCEAP